MSLFASDSETARACHQKIDILERLAAVLGTTAATFFSDNPSTVAPVPAVVMAAQESSELIKAFSEISDPDKRQRCLAYMKAVALAASS